MLVEGETLKVSSNRQDMMRHLDVQRIIINLLKDGMHNLSEIYNDNISKSIVGRQHLIHLYTLCYKFLYNFVIGNHTNQKIMFANIHIFSANLEINVEQIPFICEIFRGNVRLC
jgi:hypothetical protein